MLALFGGTTEARVAYVMEVKGGQEPVRLDTVKAVSDAYDPTRNAVYYYHLLFDAANGERVFARLNYGQAVRPLLSIGDAVTISYNRADPAEIIDRNSIRTWAFGFFFIGTGLLVFIPQLFLYLAADKPIVIDPIMDYEDIARR